MPGRPSKPVKILEMEKKSHRTKKEIAQRKRGETSTLSGMELSESNEVKKNPDAHLQFMKISELLEAVEKNDALYSEVINRYCLLSSECKEMARRRDCLSEQMDYLDKKREDMDTSEYFEIQKNLSGQLLSYDRQIQQKRKMMFDIEKENIMTIAAALRSVPKQTEKKINPLMEALNG